MGWLTGRWLANGSLLLGNPLYTIFCNIRFSPKLIFVNRLIVCHRIQRMARNRRGWLGCWNGSLMYLAQLRRCFPRIRLWRKAISLIKLKRLNLILRILNHSCSCLLCFFVVFFGILFKCLICIFKRFHLLWCLLGIICRIGRIIHINPWSHRWIFNLFKFQ